jgi:hypothetical protein
VTRDQIVERLFVGKNFNECLSKMEPDHLRDDLKMEVITVVCGWPDDKVIDLHSKGVLEFYVVRVILNMVKSKSSPFYKKYRTIHQPFNSANTGRAAMYEADTAEVTMEYVSMAASLDVKLNKQDGESIEDRETREGVRQLQGD